MLREILYVPTELSPDVPSLTTSKLNPLPEAPAVFAVTFGKLPTSVGAVPDCVTAVIPPWAFTPEIVIAKSFVGVAPATTLPSTLNFCPV